MDLNEFKDKMTLYYSKRTGEIQTFCTGSQNMNLFSTNKQDYELIWDFLVLDYNDKVLNNLSMFAIDLDTKVLKIKDIKF